MIRSLKEAFGIDVPTYLMGIAYEVMTYDEDQNSKQKKKGWVLPYRECDAEEINAYATKYQIPARYGSDSRKHWESEEPISGNGVGGEEVYHIMVVKNLDGSDINEDDFSNINEKMTEEDDEMGIMINSRPDSVYY